MSDNKVSSFFDNLKNNKIVAPIIISAIIIVAIINFYNPVKHFITSFMPAKTVNYSEMLDISMKSYDPRFTSEGEVMNWGGGSQSLFVECSNTEFKLDDNTDFEKCNCTEVVIFTDIVFNVNMVYNAVSGSPKCIIDEWGIKLTKSDETIREGKFFSYPAGGAESLIEGGECVVNKPGGNFPITVWHDEDEQLRDEEENKKLRPPERIYYLEPGGLIALKIMVHLADTYKGLKEPNGPFNTDVMNLKTYAVIATGGTKDTVYSKQTMRIIFAEKKDSIEYEFSSEISDKLEDLRPKTIVMDSVE